MSSQTHAILALTALISIGCLFFKHTILALTITVCCCYFSYWFYYYFIFKLEIERKNNNELINNLQEEIKLLRGDPKPIPEGWKAKVDRSSGKIYYINIVTKGVQWEFPVIN
jgi:hypothetical protein